MSLTDEQLCSFKAISNFVLALGGEFGSRQHSLALYARLVEHTTLSHENAILKHIEQFRNFVTANQVAIETSDEKAIVQDTITYSEKTFINMKHVFVMADADTKKVIWSHLLTILGIMFPSSQAKEILRKMKTHKKTAETELVGDMISKIVPHLNADETNPMQAVLGLMQSGVFSELVGTMQKGMDSGSVNVQSLLGTVGAMFAQNDPTTKLPATIEEVKEEP